MFSKRKNKARRERHFAGYVFRFGMRYPDGVIKELIHTPLPWARETAGGFFYFLFIPFVETALRMWKDGLGSEYIHCGWYNKAEMIFSVYENTSWQDWQAGLPRQ